MSGSDSPSGTARARPASIRLGTAAAESMILTLISLVFALFYLRAVRNAEAAR